MWIRGIVTAALMLAAGAVGAAEKAPDFNLKSPNGEQVHLESLLEKGPVLLDFWATWCKPCVKAMPKLQSLHEEYAERGLTVVGVNEDGPRGQAKVLPFLRAKKLTFPIAMDLDGSVMRRLRILALPTTILVGQDGEILLRLSGYSPANEARISEAIADLLPESTESSTSE